ncbi:MAG: hypothetical protein NWE94_05735 [Candidatus Bathyarchaeota archaeon]|nr:hypothetical protein [Candidatus Bathyarchaeota archaeon]
MKKWLLGVALLLALAVAAFAALSFQGLFNGGSNAPHLDPASSEGMLFEKDPIVYAELRRNSFDERVANSSMFMTYAAKDFLEWKLFGNITVLNTGTGTYRAELLSKETVQFFGNYSAALHELGLAVHSKEYLNIAGNLSQNNKDTVNFKPLTDVAGNPIIFPKPIRESWSLVDQIRQLKELGFDIENYPDLGMALSSKVIENNWIAFDDPRGIKCYSPSLTVSSTAYSDLTQTQWKLYLQFSPRFGSNTVYNSLSWDNVAELKKISSDEDGLRTAIASIFYLSPTAYNTKDEKLMDGIEASKFSLLQAADRFTIIRGLYPEGKIGPWGDDPRNSYYTEMGDRVGWGTPNAIGHFLGIDTNILGGVGWAEGIKICRNNNGPDGFLVKNYPSYDLARFVIGYERVMENAPESTVIGSLAPSVLRLAGFPVNHIGISPVPPGNSGMQYAVGITQNIVKELKNTFSNETFLLGPGYTISMFSCAEGLKKDGVNEASAYFGSSSIRLFKTP